MSQRVVKMSQWEIGVVTVANITVGELGVMGETIVVTVEGWFITVV